MKELQSGDILTRISDGSKWKFLHYKAIDVDPHAMMINYDENNFPVKDTSKVNVVPWNSRDNSDSIDYEEYSTSEFEID